MRLQLSAALCICFFAFGCAATGVIVIKQLPARSPDAQLDVYSSEAEIKRPYEVVCVIDSRTSSSLLSDRTPSRAVKQTRSVALQHGADAILIVKMEMKGQNSGSWGQGFAVIKAIKYTK